MWLSIEQSPLLVETLTVDQVSDALAALSVLTRALVKGELEKALLDTSVDYHRENDRGAQLLLAKEVGSLTIMIQIIVKVDKEYREEDGS